MMKDEDERRVTEDESDESREVHKVVEKHCLDTVLENCKTFSHTLDPNLAF